MPVGFPGYVPDNLYRISNLSMNYAYHYMV
jgi:hypothetical protein